MNRLIGARGAIRELGCVDDLGGAVGLEVLDLLDPQAHGDLALVLLGAAEGFEREAGAGVGFALAFHGGLAKVLMGQKIGYIEKSGATEIAVIYDNGESFQEGLAKVTKNEQILYLDTEGNPAFDFPYEFGGIF